jgi:serine/threonine protein kinase
MFNSNKLNDQMKITQNKLGHGAFGSVYVAIDNNNNEIAVKCESKEKKNSNLTLLREFKISRKIFIINKYLNIVEDHNKEQNKNIIENLENNNSIHIYKYIVDNDLLLIPQEFKKNRFVNNETNVTNNLYKIVPQVYSYIECDDFNFLTMQLCGDNFENIFDKYKLTENCKYYLVYNFLYILSCIHKCGIVHRDIKLSNFVLNNKLSNNDNNKNIIPMIIDLGLAKEYYKYENGKVLLIQPYQIKSITGTIRYISMNIHAYQSPTIVDDLISLCYCLVVIVTGKQLPWVGHKKDTNKFEFNEHKSTNCSCGYHKNKLNNNLKLNSIAEIKYHTPFEELVPNKYSFIIKWLKYLYSLKPKQLPNYNFLFKTLKSETPNLDFENLNFEII